VPYPLPDEEDITAVRQELARLIEERDAPVIRRQMIDRYVRGEIEMEAIQPGRIAAKVQERVRVIVKRGTEADWRATRRQVYERDRGICHVCGRDVAWDAYECGHIIDRVCGGTDRPSNLVTMHALCNQLKPLHETRAEYLAWVEGGAWMSSIIERLTGE
jgi:hypothetical protein